MTRRGVVLVMVLLVVAIGTTVEILDVAAGRRIATVVTECTYNGGSCKWRVLATDGVGEFLRNFCLFPGLAVYPLAPAAAFLALYRGRRATALGPRLAWFAAAAAVSMVLVRFVWLGVFSAVTF
jgi:hypothetical protein